jgi:FG-GAP-like repeat
MIADLEKSGPRPRTMQVDMNGDGRKDLIVWQAFYDLAPKTHLFVFLRGADGRLPEQPSQILHCRGYPIPIGSTSVPVPVGDLKGDGTCELVLVEPKLMLGSVGGMVNMALSRGMEMALTIRTFNHGAFSRSADASVPFTLLLSWYGTAQWSFFVLGDFNGDGRPDFVAQSSSSEWDIYPSTNDGHWFKAQPMMSFQMPTDGYFERRNFDIADLNGDGRADIVLRNIDDPRIVIFLTQPLP